MVMAVAVLGSFVIAIFAGLGTILIVRGLRSGPLHATCGNRACRYDVRGLLEHTDRCPECGSRFEDVGITPPGRGRNSGFIVTGMFVILIPMAGALMTSFVIAHRAQQQAQTARPSILLLPNPSAPAPQAQDPAGSSPLDSTLEKPVDEGSDNSEDE